MPKRNLDQHGNTESQKKAKGAGGRSLAEVRDFHAIESRLRLMNHGELVDLLKKYWNAPNLFSMQNAMISALSASPHAVEGPCAILKYNWRIEGPDHEDDGLVLNFKDDEIRLGCNCYGGRRDMLKSDAKIGIKDVLFEIIAGGCGECCSCECYQFTLTTKGRRIALKIESWVECCCDDGDVSREENAISRASPHDDDDDDDDNATREAA